MWDHSKQSGFLGGGPGLRRDESLWYKTLGTSLMAALCLLAHWLGQSKLLLFSLLLVCGRNQSLVGGITTVHTDSSQLNGYWLQWAQTLAHTFNMNGAWLFCSFFFFSSSRFLVTFRTLRLCELWAWKETVLSLFSGETCSSLNKLPREFLQTILSSGWKWPLSQSEKNPDILHHGFRSVDIVNTDT